MKKLSKVAALLATGALLLGGAFLSCSSDGLPPELSGNSSGGGEAGSGSGSGGGSGGDGDSSTPVTGFFWNADDWVFETDSKGSESAKDYGRVTFDREIKTTYVATAAGTEVPVTVGGKDYTIKSRIQISKGGEAKKYSVSFTVGKNTTSIGIFAKHSSSNGSDPVVLATESGTTLTTWTVTNADDYKPYTFDATGRFTANTKVYVYNSGSTGGVNIKAIWAEPVVEETITFVPETKTVANDVDTLGIKGTSVQSNDEEIATVKISDDTNSIEITSVKAGPATITVKDGDKEATIPVTVGSTGTVATGTITKYVNEWTQAEYYNTATSKTITAGGTNNDVFTLATGTAYSDLTTASTYNQLDGVKFNNIEGTETTVVRGLKLTSNKGLVFTVPAGKKASVTLIAVSKDTSSTVPYLKNSTANAYLTYTNSGSSSSVTPTANTDKFQVSDSDASEGGAKYELTNANVPAGEYSLFAQAETALAYFKVVLSDAE